MDDMPAGEFDRYVRKAIKLEKWRRGGDEEDEIVAGMRDLLRR